MEGCIWSLILTAHPVILFDKHQHVKTLPSYNEYLLHSFVESGLNNLWMWMSHSTYSYPLKEWVFLQFLRVWWVFSPFSQELLVFDQLKKVLRDINMGIMFVNNHHSGDHSQHPASFVLDPAPCVLFTILSFCVPYFPASSIPDWLPLVSSCHLFYFLSWVWILLLLFSLPRSPVYTSPFTISHSAFY